MDNTTYSSEVLSIDAEKASVMLLSCMDYRFLERMAGFMDTLGLRNQYDHFVLAGASLGLDPAATKKPDWERTWWDHLKIAIDLHKVSRVIIVDHEDCGAYCQFIKFCTTPQDLAEPTQIPPEEIEKHGYYLRNAYKKIRQRFPQLAVDLYLIGLGTNVLQIPP